VVEAAQNHPPSVVLIDMQVGSMGGMAVVRRLREAIAMGQIEPTRLVLLLDRSADRFLAKRAGADASVLKPFTAQDLRPVLFAD
jgi:DNA-binding response OmpR family regulator